MSMDPPAYGDHGAIRSLQQRKLKILLSALRDRNPFYGPRIEAASLDPGSATIESFCSRFPSTTRAEWIEDQTANPPFGTNLTFAQSSYSRVCRTSGTSGKPMFWLDTPESWDAMLDNWRRVYDVCGVTAESRILFAFSFGPFLGFWTAFEAATGMGCLCVPTGGFSSASRLDLMREAEIDVLCCTPTYALRLAEVAAEQGVDRGALAVRTILVAGEPGGSVPSVREHISSLWGGARIRDQHGMTEVGPVSYPCPAEPDVLHVMESSYLPEVIDPESDGSVEDGETGELVLTTLDRIGSPLLRYRTGDVVRAVHRNPCVCGTAELTLEGGILGRSDDMVCIRGVNIWPSAIDEVVRSIEGIAEYQVIVDASSSLPGLHLRIEPDPAVNDRSALQQLLQANLKHVTSLRVPVELAESGSLPRHEFKARRWERK